MTDRKARQKNDLAAGEVQLMFDMAQGVILDRIDGHVAALEAQDIRPPHIDGLPARSREASAIGNVIADMVAEARAKAAENRTAGGCLEKR